MQIWGIRLFFIIATGIACFNLTDTTTARLGGIAVACILVAGEFCFHLPRARRFIASAMGLAFGLLLSQVLLRFLPQSPVSTTQGIDLNSSLELIITFGLGYIGMVSGYYISGSLPVVRLLDSSRYSQIGALAVTPRGDDFKILDTSVIIDGRILEICQTQFIDGTLLIPRFVLNELQHIADSTDFLRRNKGRRGFDILRSLQKSPFIAVEIIEEEVTHLTEVDAKLVHLARKYVAKIITNDQNLNKVAELQGVKVLNINELANAIRPIVIAGEIIQVHLQKVGKEPKQGVGYLDDGTMVIVEDGKAHIGQTLDVVVTQMLRTSTGQMIFARNADSPAPEKGTR